LKKGVTLIELVVVVALGAILLSIASLSVIKVKEGRALVEGKNKIVQALRQQLVKSFNTGEIYEIKFDYNIKKIEVREITGIKTLKEQLELPKILKYTTVYDDAKLSEAIALTNSKGGMVDSFSIYIFGVDDKARYRISIDKINKPSGLAYINTYKNKNSDINYDNVQVKHYDFNYDKWKKE